jgi:hypothetical protein
MLMILFLVYGVRVVKRIEEARIALDTRASVTDPATIFGPLHYPLLYVSRVRSIHCLDRRSDLGEIELQWAAKYISTYIYSH